MNTITSPAVNSALSQLRASARPDQVEAIGVIVNAIDWHDTATVQQANAWHAVSGALSRVSPGWLSLKNRGRDCAIEAIEQLARQRDMAVEIAAAAIIVDAQLQSTCDFPSVKDQRQASRLLCVVVEAGR